jgi:hypothetical protein
VILGAGGLAVYGWWTFENELREDQIERMEKDHRDKVDEILREQQS